MIKSPTQVVQGISDAFAASDVHAVPGRMREQIEWNGANTFPDTDGHPYIGPETVLNGVLARCMSLG